ncbi:MAG: DUF4139 domain-containing protein [Gammaproteobacteria bacterium]|nr:DUF4139 domain-containing protein [Gammaproteobacteria bacterium]
MTQSALSRFARTVRPVAGAVFIAASLPIVSVANETALTIYSSAGPGAIAADSYRPVDGVEGLRGASVPGFAIVRDERELDLPAGRSQQRFSDVAAYIDPTTVNFVSLTDPSTRVLEQSFQFDLVNSRKLLARYVGRPVTVERVQGGQVSTLAGTLLAAGDGLVLRANDGTVSTLREYAAIRFPELPGGLITQPTLEWLLNSPRGGKQRTRVSYETGGISWWADYNLVFKPGRDANDGTLDLSAWVSIINLSGVSFRDSRLKLVAGDVRRAPPADARGTLRQMEVMATSAPDADAGFSEQAFSEFHLYTLGRRTDLPDNSTRQIELFDQVKQVPARKRLVYRALDAGGFYGSPALEREFGDSSSRKVAVLLEFRNDKSLGLGVPLPAGRIRERKQVDFAVDTRARWLEEEIEVKLRNRKDEAVEVQVIEPMFRSGEWKMLRETQAHAKLDARQIQYAVRLAKNGEAVLRYRVRYSW